MLAGLAIKEAEQEEECDGDSYFLNIYLFLQSLLATLHLSLILLGPNPNHPSYLIKKSYISMHHMIHMLIQNGCDSWGSIFFKHEIYFLCDICLRK